MELYTYTRYRYECMVCYYAIKHDTAIWCCPCCSHIFHLFCIKKWARSTVALIDGIIKFPESNLKYSIKFILFKKALKAGDVPVVRLRLKAFQINMHVSVVKK